MKIVITGALGHIGSRLIRTLPERFPGATFVLVDNMSAQRYCSLFDLPTGVDYRFVEADVLTDDPADWLEGADVCVHLAAITDATSSFDRPEEVEAVNLTGAERVARACAANDVAMLFLSTTSVYGPQGDEVDEECDESELAPQSPYAQAKLRAERRLAKIAEEDGLRYVIFRFGTIFGVSPGMRFHTAVNKFCWLASLGKPLTVWRTAYEQRRPYLDLEDGVRAIAFAIEGDLFDNSVYNVVTANLTVRDIVEMIRTSIPDTEVGYVDTEIMNQHSYSVSAVRISGRGFYPQGDPRAGIHRTLELLKGVRTTSTQKAII
ncbi:MAG: SDR family oxidoreductase [Euryarchaeota archaeon]|nr:SDR family oxidoreductase [Euryarchaeota archaeon]